MKLYELQDTVCQKMWILVQVSSSWNMVWLIRDDDNDDDGKDVSRHCILPLRRYDTHRVVSSSEAIP